MRPVYNHAPGRVLRHLDTSQLKTFLHARIPRLECPTNELKQAKVSWAEERARFTALFERLAIMVLKEKNIEGAGKILRISWDEAWHILKRAVARGRARKRPRAVKQMSADEKSVGKGHNYLTLIYDLDGATVEHITDIWDPYLASIREHVPAAAAKLVFDRYHPMTHMVKIVDSVRKQEHWEMKNEGNDILTETKCLWLYSRENVPERRRRMFSALRKMRLRTARAWAMKHVEAWYGWAICSRLKPGKAVARMY
jgi:transposase